MVITCTSIFLGQSPKAIEIKTKINKWGVIKLTSFCTAKEAINRTKKTTYRMGENICKWCNWKGLISKIYEQLIQLNNKKKQSNQKMVRRSKETSKEEIWMANRHMKRCSTSLTLEKCKSKLQWGTTSYRSEWPSFKSLWTTNAGEGVEKREPSYAVGGNVTWCSHCGKQYGGSSEN